MKSKKLKLLCALFTFMQVVVAGRLPTAEASTLADRSYTLGVQAYIYAYPMILMEVTRRVSTNVEAPTGFRVPMNQFGHLRAFPDHTFKEVVRPNADTLYSIVWFDVLKEPQVLSIPDTGGRYYMLPMLDMWTDVFAAPGSRTSGTKAANFAIVGPTWRGDLPDGVESVRSPTNIGWIIGRTQTNGTADYEHVHRIQDGYKLTPLSQWGTSSIPPAKGPVNSAWDMNTPPPVQVAKMSAKAYFELFATLLKDNPPHELDWNMVEQLKQIGIVPGEDFNFSHLSSEKHKALERAVGDAQKMIVRMQMGEAINGWQVAREMMGNYGTSYLRRAFIALIGLGANVPEDAVYPISKVDSEGTPYSGSHRYVLHFDKSEIPPIRGFWSLSMYGEEMYFVENPIRRYAIGDRDQLQFNPDGSLDISIQHASPSKGKESNWLPAPKGNFDLVLRAYWPRREVLTGDWNPPAVTRIE
jgi:hypothetical protein